MSNFSTQLNSVDGHVTSLNSSLKSYKNGLLSLQSNFTTLATDINNVVSRQSATVRQRLSDLDDSIISLQTTDDETSIKLNTLKIQADQLKERLRQNGATISHPTGVVMALSLLL